MTKIFLDSANLEEIKEILKWGIIEGVTTNQKIFLKEKGVDFETQSKAILELVAPYPVSLEGPNDFQGIIDFATRVKEWKERIFDVGLWNPIIKIPMLANGDGLRAIKFLRGSAMLTNATACITLNQVFLAMSARSNYVSLFYNRMKDWKYHDYHLKHIKAFKEGKARKKLSDDEIKEFAYMYAIETVSQAQELVKGTSTKLIVGSIRSVEDIEDLIPLKPDFITIPYKILKEMPVNAKTIETLKEFEDAWEEFNKK